MKDFKYLTCFFIVAFAFQNIYAQELPKASFENCFYIMPLYERLRTNALSFEEKEHEIIKMKEQLGQGNLYHRLGFSFIYPVNSDAEVRENCQLANKHRIHLGLIFGYQSHTRDDYREIAKEDLRLFQWRMNGTDWKGAFSNTGTLEIAENQRDYKIPTPSRYALPLRDYNLKKAYHWGIMAKKLMDDYPGVITCINGPIEEELAIGGHSDSNKIADYSPYAITEFRDWLCHTGFYDDKNGIYAGEGADSNIIGGLIEVDGLLRSQFYDDPNPDNNNNTGVSFNHFYGTEFTTWKLKYWDLEEYPASITNEGFDCTPEKDIGYCQGGFDAPRNSDYSNKLWRAWSWDIPDQQGKYPLGNPVNPAFGFRQHMVRNFVRDLMDTIAAAGILRKMMYAHQIPGEALGKFTGAGGRNRSSASTVWTGFLEKSMTVGITRFGDIDPALLTQYSNDWGIFEWHTQPNSNPDLPALYAVSTKALNRYYNHKCHLLFPGWWNKKAPDDKSIFPLNDSKFAEAIKDFYQSKVESPYYLQEVTFDYTPPVVRGVKGEIDDNGQIKVSWSSQIWEDLLPFWSDWEDFDHFEIGWSVNEGTWNEERTDKCYFALELKKGSCDVKVRAVTKKGTHGTWSKTMVVSHHK